MNHFTLDSAFLAPIKISGQFLDHSTQRRFRSPVCPSRYAVIMCEPVTSIPQSIVELRDILSSDAQNFTRKTGHDSLSRPSFRTESDSCNVSLPQYVSSRQRAQRIQQLSEKRKQYQWTYKAISDAALIASLPASELPNRRWVVMMKRVENRCNENREAISKTFSLNSEQQTRALQDNIKHDPFDRFKKQFASVELPKIAMENSFLRDEIFGWYRIAGPNPMVVKRLKSPVSKSFPVLDNDIFRSIHHFENDSLEEAFTERRLFEVDYSHLHHIGSGRCRDDNGKEGMYLYSPRLLLAIPRNRMKNSPILPIAIQCGPINEVVHTASRKHTSFAAWQAAKLSVQVADAFVHETVFHFARTHLLLEAILCASYRTLPSSHPILRLLSCHFEGTAFINDSSLKALICPGGPIDLITAPLIEDTRKFAAQSLIVDFNFTQAMPDTDFINRGVDKISAPELQYPYRDDALELWDSIVLWTKDYIDVYYHDDKDVLADYELQAWGKEVSEKGKIVGFGSGKKGEFLNKNSLIRTVAMIIFTASVQHAAVNFPQKDMMQFTPAMPLAGYADVPHPQELWTENNEMSGLEGIQQMFPRLKQAEEQLRAAELLGVVRYTRLGQYGKRLEFAGENVVNGLQRFQMRLDDLEKKIVSRNDDEDTANLVPYSFLRPSLIPQSTNV